MMDDRLNLSRMIAERALVRASNLFSINGVQMVASAAEHERDVAYVANLFTIAAALRERAIEEAF